MDNSSPDLDPDLSPLELPPIVVSAFNLENGFVKSFPPELLTVCRRLYTDLPSEHLVEIIGGGYSFLSWNNRWIIIIGFALTFESNSDSPLTGLIPPGEASMDWVLPPSSMESALGTHLLRETKECFPSFSCQSHIESISPIPLTRTNLSNEVMFETGEIIARLEFRIPTRLPSIALTTERKEYLRDTLELNLKVKEVNKQTISFLVPDFILGPRWLASTPPCSKTPMLNSP